MLEKYLYQIDDTIYKIAEGSYVEVGPAPATEEMFIEHGNDSIDKDSIASVDSAKLLFYTQDPSVIGASFVSTCLYKDQLILQDYDFELNNIKKITITATTPNNTNLRFLMSNDSGATWYIYSSGWKEVSTDNILTEGLTHIQVNAITTTYLTQFISESNKLRFAIGMSHSASGTTPSIDHIRIEY